MRRGGTDRRDGRSRERHGRDPGSRRRRYRGPLADELARWIPAVTLLGALLLCGSEILAFAHGASTALAVVSHLLLAAVLSYAASRAALAVVSHYERRNRDDAGDRRPL